MIGAVTVTCAIPVILIIGAVSAMLAGVMAIDVNGPQASVCDSRAVVEIAMLALVVWFIMIETVWLPSSSVIF